jgi:hypothetical protein
MICGLAMMLLTATVPFRHGHSPPQNGGIISHNAGGKRRGFASSNLSLIALLYSPKIVRDSLRGWRVTTSLWLWATKDEA